MSRAFVKEDESGPPPIIPPRAALPPGTPNYVTPQGLAMLRAELADLEGQRALVDANHAYEADRTRLLTIINGRLSALSDRLASAKVVDLRGQTLDQVRFGTTVTIQPLNSHQPGIKQNFTIVGVDEASVAQGKVAFVAPVARALMGCRVGQTVTLPTGRGDKLAKVVAITYYGANEPSEGNAPQ